MKNNENPLLNEETKYNPNYENEYVKFAKIKFAGEEGYTVFENLNFGTKNKGAEWLRDDGTIYNGIVDANPTSTLAQFSGTLISKDGENWQLVSDLAE